LAEATDNSGGRSRYPGNHGQALKQSDLEGNRIGYPLVKVSLIGLKEFVYEKKKDTSGNKGEPHDINTLKQSVNMAVEQKPKNYGRGKAYGKCIIEPNGPDKFSPVENYDRKYGSELNDYGIRLCEWLICYVPS
jgi:hypothetical protein